VCFRTRQAAAALQCAPSVPERMLTFCAAPEALRARILQLFDGGGPAQWPKAVSDSDTFPCAPRCVVRVVRARARAYTKVHREGFASAWRRRLRAESCAARPLPPAAPRAGAS
jgi:hypothetical protein